MEQALRTIQQAILDENYSVAEQLVAHLLQHPFPEQDQFSFFCFERTIDAQQLYNRAVVCLENQNYAQAFYLFRSTLSFISDPATQDDYQRIIQPALSPIANQVILNRRSSKHGRSNEQDGVPVTKNYVRDNRPDSPEPTLPTAPPTSPQF